MIETDSPDDDDTVREIVLSKKYTPIELQDRLGEMVERLAVQREQTHQLKLWVKEVLDLQKSNYQSAFERQQHLDAHGSHRLEAQMTHSSEFLDAVNDLVKVFWDAHKSELKVGGVAVVPKLSKKDEARAKGIEVNRVSQYPG